MIAGVLLDLSTVVHDSSDAAHFLEALQAVDDVLVMGEGKDTSGSRCMGVLVIGTLWV
jgi:hypothetical protein